MAASVGAALRAVATSCADLVDETSGLLQREPGIISKQTRPDYYALSSYLARITLLRCIWSLLTASLPVIVLGLAFRAISLLFSTGGERLLGTQAAGAAVAAAGVVGSLITLVSYATRDVLRGAAGLLIGSVGRVRLGAISGSMSDASLVPTAAKLSARKAASVATLWADVCGCAAQCNMRLLGAVALSLTAVFMNYVPQ